MNIKIFHVKWKRVRFLLLRGEMSAEWAENGIKKTEYGMFMKWQKEIRSCGSRKQPGTGKENVTKNCRKTEQLVTFPFFASTFVDKSKIKAYNQQ